MKLKFSGKRILILGGSCEPAVFLAEYTIKAGLFPILTYRNEKGLKKISKKLYSFAGKYESVFLDFADTTSLDSMFCRINDDLDFLVDFAHGNMESLVASANEDDICRYFAENISFRAKILKRAGRVMLKKRNGRLVFVSSSAASRPNLGQGFYAAAKLASEALYKNLGLELGCRGITTVTLRPGYIDSGRGRRYMQTHERETCNITPIKRLLTCKEVAETILFFLSDSACGFNATEISMDGGLIAGK